MSTSDTMIDSHLETTKMDIHEVVRQLNNHLGPTLVAALANVRDPKLPHRWAKASGTEPRFESSQRLQAAHRIWGMISNADSDSIARQWFIGCNPRLGEMAPYMALREGDIPAVLAAAKAFVEGTDD